MKTSKNSSPQRFNIQVSSDSKDAEKSLQFQFLVPDAPELIQGYLEGEQDPSCKRNAFIMLIHTDQQRALTYLQSCIDEIGTFG